MRITESQLRKIIREEVAGLRGTQAMRRGATKQLTAQQAFEMLEELAPVDAQDGVTLDAAQLAGMGITPGVLKGVMKLADEYDIYWMMFNDDGSVELVDPLSQ